MFASGLKNTIKEMLIIFFSGEYLHPVVERDRKAGLLVQILNEGILIFKGHKKPNFIQGLLLSLEFFCKIQSFTATI